MKTSSTPTFELDTTLFEPPSCGDDQPTHVPWVDGPGPPRW